MVYRPNHSDRRFDDNGSSSKSRRKLQGRTSKCVQCQWKHGRTLSYKSKTHFYVVTVWRMEMALVVFHRQHQHAGACWCHPFFNFFLILSQFNATRKERQKERKKNDPKRSPNAPTPRQKQMRYPSHVRKQSKKPRETMTSLLLHSSPKPLSPEFFTAQKPKPTALVGSHAGDYGKTRSGRTPSVSSRYR